MMKSGREQERYVASQYRLMWLKFRKHKPAIIGIAVLFIFYFGAIFCEFLTPYSPEHRNDAYLYAPPQSIHFFDRAGFHLRPFVYGLTMKRNAVTWQDTYVSDPKKEEPIHFFVHGDRYKLWGLFPSSIHLFGVERGTIFLFGTDSLGRDLFTRILYGSRISLSVGLVGVAMSFILGLLIGGLSGYFGGRLDTLIQRIIEFIRSIPVIPLWMALAAAVPASWPPLKVYFAITIILSIIGWTELARVVRGKLISLREEDFVMAARLAGATDFRIITRHLIPSFLSYLIVALTLAVPQMILGETALSFLGLGLRPPVVSWGVLLSRAQDIHNVALAPWLLIPGLFVVVAVLSFNFVGDGLRDAADPYR